jgi:hypothetical protein
VVTTSSTRLGFCATVVKLRLEPLCIGRLRGRAVQRTPNDSEPEPDLLREPVQKVDVAQRVDELLFLYTNIRLRHQRNKTTVGRIVPSHLPTDYNGGLLVTAQNCSGFGI